MTTCYIGAAVSAINQKDNLFRDYYERMVADGIMPSNARHAVARKLLTVVWVMWQRFYAIALTLSDSDVL